MKEAKNYPYYEHSPVAHLKELLEYCAKSYTDRIAFQFQEKKQVISVSYLRFRDEVYALGTAIFHSQDEVQHIGILGENSYEWILVHFATTCCGGVAVPIDKELDADSVIHLLSDSECTRLFYSNAYADIADVVQSRLPSITCFCMKDIPEMVRQGKALLESGKKDCIEREIRSSDLASIVYTSGTTGIPKGVLLTHKNLCASMYGATCNVLLSGPSLLVLPLHHTFGLVAGVFAVMLYGFPIYINRSLKRLSDDFIKAKPENLFAVPLIVETLYKNIWSTARKSGKEALLRKLVKFSNLLLKCGIDLRKRLFRSVRNAFGGELNIIVSGGAPLDDKYILAFRSFGITVLNGYGITECGPVVAVNRNRFIVPRSVGLPLPCNRVRISEEGEIQVAGDNVTHGYYHLETENRKAFTEDGWFRTGDIGFLDKYSALHITGRIKNLIILGNGENIPAEAIEEVIYKVSYVKECIVYGKDNVIIAEMYLDEDVPDAKDRIGIDIRTVNQRLPQNRNIGKVIIRDTEFPKTTTKKIKRDYGG